MANERPEEITRRVMNDKKISSDEKSQLIRCNRYFDILETVTKKIKDGFRESESFTLLKDDWDILSNYMYELGEIVKKHVDRTL